MYTIERSKLNIAWITVLLVILDDTWRPIKWEASAVEESCFTLTPFESEPTQRTLKSPEVPSRVYRKKRKTPKQKSTWHQALVDAPLWRNQRQKWWSCLTWRRWSHVTAAEESKDWICRVMFYFFSLLIEAPAGSTWCWAIRVWKSLKGHLSVRRDCSQLGTSRWWPGKTFRQKAEPWGSVQGWLVALCTLWLVELGIMCW